MILYVFYLAFVFAGVLIFLRVIQLEVFYRPSEIVKGYCIPSTRTKVLEPDRGNIYARDGRLLATSMPTYQIWMDCTVLKKEIAKIARKDPDRAKKMEETWRSKASELAKGLAEIYGKPADEMEKMILDGRKNGNGYLKIGGLIDYSSYVKVKQLPLFNEGKNKGGMIDSAYTVRMYPYGMLANRAIGRVRNNNPNSTNLTGIEGRYNEQLHGTKGYEPQLMTDRKKYIRDYGKRLVKPKDGMDIRTTLDVDIQDIADATLRKHIEDDYRINWGSVIIMDVKTGAIRAMVNLEREAPDWGVEEVYNHGIGTASEMGSVFKTTTLMTLLEEGKVGLSTKIPTDHGRLPGYRPDNHITDFERINKTDSISVMRGFEMSSNYVFRKLAMDYYGSTPEKMIEKLDKYHLTDNYDFDIDGFGKPDVPKPGTKFWGKTSLGNIAIGYVKVTPLHIVTFYNAIANKGRMMKPYLVESIEENGDVVKKYGPTVLENSICSKATADSLTVALRGVVTGGTARRVGKARWDVAGKTGTAFQVLSSKERLINSLQQVDVTKMAGNSYMDTNGRQKKQSTFVGFFPADDPKYTCIVTLRSYHGIGNQLDGSSVPAETLKDIVNRIYVLDASNGETIRAKSPMPDLAGKKPEIVQGKVPDVVGAGISDAIYAIENSGYKCSVAGSGTVKSQHPAAGTELVKGATVKIELK